MALDRLGERHIVEPAFKSGEIGHIYRAQSLRKLQLGRRLTPSILQILITLVYCVVRHQAFRCKGVVDDIRGVGVLHTCSRLAIPVLRGMFRYGARRSVRGYALGSWRTADWPGDLSSRAKTIEWPRTFEEVFSAARSFKRRATPNQLASPGQKLGSTRCCNNSCPIT